MSEIWPYFGIGVVFLTGIWVGVITVWHWPRKCDMPEPEEPPQPTISSEAMHRSSKTARWIDNQVVDTIWAKTNVRNNRGMPHVDIAEVSDLCNSIEAAVVEIVDSWLPAPGAEGEKP